MPAFGKSGTWRIFALSWSMLRLPDLKPGVAPACPLFTTFYASHATPSRSVSDLTLEPLERVRVAFRGDLNPAVAEIPHPAVQPLAGGHRLGEEPEADPLDTSSNHVPARPTHDSFRMPNPESRVIGAWSARSSAPRP